MILLDTNVISELMRPVITPVVVAFIQTHPAEEIFTASLCEAEIRYGIARLPPGKRREALSASFQALLDQGFAGRIIAFDSTCAAGYAVVRIRREQAGLPIGVPDAMIAGTALAHGASIATRNAADFVACGVTVVNPWTPPG